MSKRSDAIRQLLWDARSEKTSKASYRRVMRACKVLELDEDERREILEHLWYLDNSGNPHKRFTD